MNIIVVIMVVKTRREEYAALTRAAILDAALELFATDGYGPSSIDAIARHARVSKGAFYHHFPDKQAIFDEVLQEQMRLGVAEVVEGMARAQATAEFDGREVALAGAREMLRVFGESEARRSLMRQAQGVLGVDRLREIDEKDSLPLVRANLALLAERGELRDVDLDLTAVIIFDLLCSAAMTISSADDPDAATARAQEIVGHMVSGLFREQETPTTGE
ncbi:TetR/AcrR family transcriptional regulator [Antrihabitans cavernicola]|uniref:TetR/AcrR family transcriptional regulator n=1 Tax=Antrihabitans cavernicola TaxID=2495913 RepID=A0A5A7S2P4_9NOCA|nr:TetR/AcrR family transcriptional regulator [Spelaeibacter cavernicola]KAA0016315.1 TetR/AcrR family transcriptional regulator [Spelaeibacter cavernicola]